MPTKPDMAFPESRGDVTLDPFQLDSLRPLLLEQEMRIKSHFDRRMEQLSMLLQHSPETQRRSSTIQQTATVSASPDEQLGMRAGVPPHLIQLIDRVKANHEKNIFNGQVSFNRSLPFFESANVKRALSAGMEHYDHFADLLVVVYSVCIGVEIHHTSVSRSEPPWARQMEIAFCIIFFLDLLIRLFIERKRFFTGSRRWWNLLDALSVSMLLAALLEGSRFVGNLAAFIRVARIMRLARFLWTFKMALTKWTHLGQLRVLLTSMAESVKVMLWLVLLICGFIYVCALLLTESIWDSCPNDATPLVCVKFDNLLTSSMTLFQIIYNGLLWGELWDELRALQWYVQGVFLSYVMFGMIVLVNTITSFICSLQSTVSKRERDVLIDNAMDHNERLVRQLYRIFKDFDQNGNGAISWAEFQLALADERMHAFLNALELDMSDAVKVFQILASESTGAIEESDFLLGCLRLRGGATAVDMVRMQMEQEWMRTALLQLKTMMQKAVGDVETLRKTLEKKSLWERAFHPDVDSRADTPVALKQRSSSADVRLTSIRRQDSRQSLGSSSSDEPIHHYQRTSLKTSERAVTLEQLKIIDQELERWCRGWKDAFSGETISVETLNLYQFSYHHILSHTAPPDGVLLQWPAALMPTKDLPQIGAEVHQRCPHMKLPRARGKVISAEVDTAEKGSERLIVCVRLLQGQFRSEEEMVFIGDLELPAEEMTVRTENSICYKELLSPEACLPVWYCSHWWGERIHAFVQCCEKHATLRRLGDLGSYWVCGYANRQHELNLEIAEDVIQTSFFTALSASRGLLLILDEAATPFSRIWCDYELYSAVTNPNMELDIAASTKKDGRQEANIITKNLVPGESAVAKSAREQDFPIFLLNRGLEVCLERGNTTQEQDKTHIFQAIAQSRDLETIEGQERLQLNLSRANQALHSTLAVLAWPQAMHKNLLPKHGKGSHSNKLNVCDALLQDNFRESLDLSLAHFEESCTDSVVKTLAESLPLSLVKLKLSFEGCARLTDVSLQALTNRFMQLKLKQLHLDFVGCQNLTDAGLRLLATFLQKSNLFELELHFAGCVRLHSLGISILKENLPSSIRSFKGSFKGTQINRNFRDLNDFQEFKVKS